MRTGTGTFIYGHIREENGTDIVNITDEKKKESYFINNKKSDIKGLVYPKMKMMSLITNPNVVPNKKRTLFVRKENHNNIIYSTILLPKLPSSIILESTSERNQRNQRCLGSVEQHACWT